MPSVWAHAFGRKRAYFIKQLHFIYGVNLRNVDDAALGQIAFLFAQQHIARRIGPL